MSPSKRAAEVEHELGAAWTRYHVAAQLARFMTGVLVSLLWSLHSGIADWTDVVPVLLGAAWATARQMWPQVPWSLVREHLGTALEPATVSMVPATGKPRAGTVVPLGQIGTVSNPSAPDTAPPPGPGPTPTAKG